MKTEIHIVVMLRTVSYTHLDVYKRQVMCAVLFVRNREGILKSRVFRVMSVLLLGTMLAVYLWRMLYVFPHAPMQLNEHAPLIRLLQLFF